MRLALGEHPDQPAVHGSEAQLAGLGPLPCTRHVLQYPAYFGGAEIGVDDESRLLANLVGQPLFLETVAVLGSAAVLPYYGVVHRLRSLRIPYNGRLALVGDAYGGYILAVDAY